jgi:hypothetical protein
LAKEAPVISPHPLLDEATFIVVPEEFAVKKELPVVGIEAYDVGRRT